MSDRPALLHDVTDKCVEHEHNENRDKDVIYRAYVTDLQQLPATNTACNYY